MEELFKVELFPNPMQHELNLVIFQETAGSVSLEIFNQLGQRFTLLSAQPLDQGHRSLYFSVATLPVGGYYYLCRSENGMAQGKMVIERR